MYGNHAEQSAKHIPGVHGLPLVGVIPSMLSNPLDVFREAAQIGDMGRIDIGPVSVYLVNHPDLIRYMLQENHRQYGKTGGIWDVLRQVLGNGLPVSQGDFWLRQRRLMQPAFHKHRLAGFVNMMGDLGGAMAERWIDLSKGGEAFDILSQLNDLTMEIIVKSMFSHSLDPEEGHAFGDALVRALKYLEYRSWLFFIPLDWPMPRKAQFERAYAEMTATMYRIIRERRATGEAHHDLLGMLMEARDEDTGEGMTDEQLRDEVMTTFLAGHETTAVTLAWALYNVAANPHIEHKLLDELQQVLGGRPPTFDDLPRLTYNKMIVDETLRLYPAAWVITRTLNEDDTVNGYHLRKGDMMMFCSYTLHRNKAYWDDPETFNPERFATGGASNRLAYMPFGHGPRICIGGPFASMAAQLLLATFMQRIHLQPATARPPVPKPLITLRPDIPVMMRADERGKGKSSEFWVLG